jgi:hypothetical protein
MSSTPWQRRPAMNRPAMNRQYTQPAGKLHTAAEAPLQPRAAWGSNVRFDAKILASAGLVDSIRRRT